MSSKTALAILAAGSEEMELIITVDVLRRAGVSNKLCAIQFLLELDLLPDLSCIFITILLL